MKPLHKPSAAVADSRYPSLKSMHAGAFIASLAVFLSRIMGLIREQILAHLFGASREYDAFLTAFRIPNLFRDLLAEGALSQAFVTVFSKELLQDKKKAFQLARSVSSFLCLILLVVVGSGIYFAPYLVQAMAMGFSAQKAELTILLTRIMFPFLGFVALAALWMGMLNAQQQFAVPQSASTVFNIVSVTTGVFLAYLFTGYDLYHLAEDHLQAARAMFGIAFGVLLGGVAQWLMQWPSIYRTGYRFAWSWDRSDPALKQIWRLMIPGILGAAAVQLNVFINSNYASLLGDKAISWLNYAFRLMQFPIGIFGVAIMTATLPLLACEEAKNSAKGFGEALSRALELVALLTIPAAVGLSLLSREIIALLYQHGRFQAFDTEQTAIALAAYAWGLPGYAALKIIQPSFVAQNRAKIPMVVSLLSVTLNAFLNYILIIKAHYGHGSLAATTSLLATLNSMILFFLLLGNQCALSLRHLLGELLKVITATSLMALGVNGFRTLWITWSILSAPSWLYRGTFLMAAILLSVFVYGLLVYMFRVAALDFMLQTIRRRLKMQR